MNARDYHYESAYADVSEAQIADWIISVREYIGKGKRELLALRQARQRALESSLHLDHWNLSGEIERLRNDISDWEKSVRVAQDVIKKRIGHSQLALPFDDFDDVPF